MQGWVVTQSQSGRFWRLENLLSLLIFEPRLVQPIASRYANCTALNPGLVQSFVKCILPQNDFLAAEPEDSVSLRPKIGLKLVSATSEHDNIFPDPSSPLFPNKIPQFK
jgi:hypothetical protein